MANKTDPTTKYFKIPEALQQGWSFMMTVEYVVDRLPAFQTVAGARKGAKLIDAVEKAQAAPPHVVAWPFDLWNLVGRYLESDAFQLPKNFLMRNGIPTDQLVPMKDYLPHIDAILEASDEEPKSVAGPFEEAQAAASQAS